MIREDIGQWLAARPAGHFTIERRSPQGIAINVHRPLGPVETILAGSAGEANRLRQRLSDEGFVGMNRGAL